MKVFIVQGNDVLVCDLAFTCRGREEFRVKLREDFNTLHVWFEDEVGTAHDPVRGPNPVFGPNAPPAPGTTRPGTGGNAGPAPPVPRRPAPPPAGPGSRRKETH